LLGREAVGDSDPSALTAISRLAADRPLALSEPPTAILGAETPIPPTKIVTKARAITVK